MSLLLDTDTISEIRKVTLGKAAPAVAAWSEAADLETLSISVVTLMELQRGCLRLLRRDPAQGMIIDRWINAMVRPTFAGRILPVNDIVALRCAALHVPDPRPEKDALIAATALVHGLTLVTRNVRDFEPMGVPLINPWEWPH